MVGVLEGLAHAASRQSIGVNAMLDEVIPELPKKFALKHRHG